MVAGGRREEAHPIFDSAAFRIRRPEIKPPDARKRYRRGTHGARLQRHIKIAVGEPFTAKRRRRRTNRNELRVRGRIVVSDGAIAGSSDHGTVSHNRTAHGYFTARSGGPGFFKGDLHK